MLFEYIRHELIAAASEVIFCQSKVMGVKQTGAFFASRQVGLKYTALISFLSTFRLFQMNWNFLIFVNKQLLVTKVNEHTINIRTNASHILAILKPMRGSYKKISLV